MQCLYFIPKHVYVCEVGNQVIFLNLRRDKYSAISLRDRLALNGYVEGWAGSASLDSSTKSAESIIQSMLREDLLTSDPSAGKSASLSAIERSHGTLIDDADCRSIQVKTVPTLFAVLRAYLRVKLAMKRHRLDYLVEVVRARKEGEMGQQVNVNPEFVQELVAGFVRVRPIFYSAKDQCLLDSMVLIEYLAQQKCFPTWVIGVRTQPFGGHSWVQDGGLVLNDRLELVNTFTPMMAV